jgi:hypothetical protein
MDMLGFEMQSADDSHLIARDGTDLRSLQVCLGENIPEALTFDICITGLIPHNHPCEPMLVVFGDGSWRIVPEGDADWIIASSTENVQQIIPLAALQTNWDEFVRRYLTPDI